MIPGIPRSRKLSLAPLGIILASIILAGVLAFLTWRNFDREERLMEGFLLEEGLTLIRTFEAGARTSMMMGPGQNSIGILAQEAARAQSVAYIAILNAQGRLLTGAGDLPKEPFPVGDVLQATDPLTTIRKGESQDSVFEVGRRFTPPSTESMWGCMMGGGSNGQANDQAIFVGLKTDEFDAARAEDVKQNLVLGGILLLLGSGGFYFLFLSQEARITRTTLETMEAYTRNVIASMPAGLITLDGQGRIVELNARAREIFNRPGVKMEGRHLRDFTGGCEEAILPLLEEDHSFLERQMECPRPQGPPVPVRVSASQLQDREGHPLGMVLMLQDMREIRAMEQALERSRRHAALGRMAAGIAHEVRNPLGTLRGFAQYFARQGGQDSQTAEYGEVMVEEIDRLNRIVSALLQFARPREPQWETVRVSALFHKAGILVEEEARTAGTKVSISSPEGLSIQGDSDLLLQALLNLLQNALAATPGGTICLEAQEEGEDVSFRVLDNGRGMTVEEKERMFDPFFTTRNEGTGLGLAVVQQVVEQHRGRIFVESVPGEGTAISIYLPAEGAAHG